MKKVLNSFLLLVVLNLLQHFAPAQNGKIDCLLTVLKTAKEDTGKVNILNALAHELPDELSDSALSCALQALQLSETIKK